YPGEAGSDDGSGPRVGDGLVRLDPDGTVAYASPNALSAYRRLGHRGDLGGLRLDEVTAALMTPTATPVDEPLAAVAAGRSPRLREIEAREAVGQLRCAAGRGGNAAGDGDHRAAAERIRARLRRAGSGRHGRAGGPPDRARRAACRGPRRRERSADRLHVGVI